MDALVIRLREAEDFVRAAKEQASQYSVEVQRLTGRCDAAEAKASRLVDEAERVAAQVEKKAKEREFQAVEDFKASHRYLGAIAEAKAKAIDEFKVSNEFVRLRAQAVEEFKDSEEFKASHVSFSQAAYNRAFEVASSEHKEALVAKYPDLDFSFLWEPSGDEEEEDDDEDLGLAVPGSILDDVSKAGGVPSTGIDISAAAAEAVETEAIHEEMPGPLELPSPSKNPPADEVADPYVEVSESAEPAESLLPSSSNPEQVL